MRIYKRVIDFDTSVETIRTLVSIASVHAHSIVFFAFILEDAVAKFQRCPLNYFFADQEHGY